MYYNKIMKELAQINPTTILTIFPPSRSFNNIGSVTTLLLRLLMLFAAIGFLVMSLYGGFSWITSGGDPKNLEKSQKIFTSAIVGLVIVVVSYILVKLIGAILNIQTPL